VNTGVRSPTIPARTAWVPASTGSKTLRPFLPTVENGDNLETIASHSVGDHVLCARHDEFPRAGNATRTTEIGQFSEAFDSLEQCASDSICSLGIVTRDVGPEVRQVLDRSR
jgi:hypothetical protein